MTQQITIKNKEVSKKKNNKYFASKLNSSTFNFCPIFYIVYRTTKKIAQKVWSKDLVYEKTFRLSSHTQYV